MKHKPSLLLLVIAAVLILVAGCKNGVTDPPDPPAVMDASILSVAEVDATFVTLAWTDEGQTQTKVFRDSTLLTTVSGIEYTDLSLTPETTYNYHVVGVFSGGDSDPSNTVSPETDDGVPIFSTVVSNSAGGTLYYNTRGLPARLEAKYGATWFILDPALPVSLDNKTYEIVWSEEVLLKIPRLIDFRIVGEGTYISGTKTLTPEYIEYATTDWAGASYVVKEHYMDDRRGEVSQAWVKLPFFANGTYILGTDSTTIGRMFIEGSYIELFDSAGDTVISASGSGEVTDDDSGSGNFSNTGGFKIPLSPGTGDYWLLIKPDQTIPTHGRIPVYDLEDYGNFKVKASRLIT